MTLLERTIPIAGESLAAWHLVGEGDAFAGVAGRPCVVMGHGFGATRDCGLQSFAERFAAAGLDVVAFDYHHFGASTGDPRGLIDLAGQRADYAAAIAFARGLDGVDAERIVIWGVSFAGGHVLQVGAEDPRLAAVISVTPAADGVATLVDLLRREGPRAGLRLTVAGLRDAVGALRGRPPVTAPIVAGPGELGALTAPGAKEAMEALAGPSWTNAVAARIFLQAGSYRPGRRAGGITCPLLVQVADADRTAPPGAAMVAAKRGRAEVRHYPCDHFDVYPGWAWHDAVVDHELLFLRRHLATAEQATATVPAT